MVSMGLLFNMVNEFTTMKNQKCLRCGRETNYVFVHGHYQCILCGQNIDECCTGEKE